VFIVLRKETAFPPLQSYGQALKQENCFSSVLDDDFLFYLFIYYYYYYYYYYKQAVRVATRYAPAPLLPVWMP